MRHPKEGEDREEDRAHRHEPEADPAELPEQDVPCAKRGRQDGLVVPAPHDLVHDRVARLEGGGLHGHCAQQSRSEEADVAGGPKGVRVGAGQEAPDAQAHGGQEHERLQEAEEEAPVPDPLVDQPVAAEEVRGGP